MILANMLIAPVIPAKIQQRFRQKVNHLMKPLSLNSVASAVKLSKLSMDVLVHLCWYKLCISKINQHQDPLAELSLERKILSPPDQVSLNYVIIMLFLT